jgi:hypothetical protein
VSAHASVHGERGGGGTDRAGPRRREKKGAHGATAWRLAIRAREIERERERAGEESWRRQVGPSGQRAREGGRARGRTAADRLGPPVRWRGRAALMGLVCRLGCFLFLSFSLDFLIPFPFLFR